MNAQNTDKANKNQCSSAFIPGEYKFGLLTTPKVVKGVELRNNWELWTTN